MGSFEASMKKNGMTSVRICLLLMFLTGLLYFNSLGNLFTNWDDGMIYQNPSIRNLSWEGIKRIFTLEKGATYQPVRVLSYAVDYHFWGLNPLGYHLTSLFFYALTCILVFFCLRAASAGLQEGGSPESHGRTALFGSLLFAAHPVHVEAVTWLAARKEVLQGFFFFLAFYLYLKGREAPGGKRRIYLGLVLFSVLLAVLSKPSAVVFPGVILVYEMALRGKMVREFFRNHWLFFIVAITISLVFTIVLIKVMFDAGGVKPYRGGSFFSNLLVSFYAFVYNIKLLFFTINYSAAYTIDVPNPILSLKTLLMVLLTLFLALGGMGSIKRRPVYFFCFFFFVVTLLPYLNIIPISTLLADRYVFLASFSYALFVGVLFERVYAFRHPRFSEGFFKVLGTAIFLFLLVCHSLMTIRQNTIWQNSYTLWADAVEKYPKSNTANALMGVVYMELGMDEKALGYLEKAVELLPYDYQSRNNLGIVYGRLGQTEKAINELATAIWLQPENDNMKINLSLVYQRSGQYDKAEQILRHVIAKTPKNANLHFRLGLLYKEAGKYEAAVSALRRASELAPHIINPYEELGNLYASRLGDRLKAIESYTRGIEMAPKAKSKIEDLRWMVQDLQAQ